MRLLKDLIKFSPLLVLYAIVVLMFSRPFLQGDEIRYVEFAKNLSHGFYSDSETMKLLNGPGYPFILLPFILLKLPWLAARLLNSLFLYAAVVYFYHALLLYMNKRPAFYFACLLGLYPAMIREAHLLVTESLTFFLMSAFLFYFCKFHRSEKGRAFYFSMASFSLGYLALTKIYFGYVLSAVLVLAFFLFLWKKQAFFRNTLLVYLMAFFICTPYLYYTYAITGRAFYWGNSGGLMLYWMSNPYDKERGDILHIEDPRTKKDHRDFFRSISGLNYVQQDDALKKAALDNIKRTPLKFLKNWTANVGRLLFSYPFSYTPQKLTTFFYFIPNMFIVVISLFCAYFSFLGRRLIPYEIYSVLLFAFISFAGMTLLAGFARYFAVLVPFILLWIFFTLARVVRIEICPR